MIDRRRAQKQSQRVPANRMKRTGTQGKKRRRGKKPATKQRKKLLEKRPE